MNLSVIGTGYVGLVAATCFAEMGNDVICMDNSPEILEKLKKSIVPIYEPGLDIIFQRNIEKKRLSFTGELIDAVLNSDIIFYCLPTPQGGDGSADLRFVLGVADETGKILKENNDNNYKIIVNKSTVPVGTGQKVKKVIESHGVKNFDIVSNPEFQREGFAVEDFMKPDRIVIGSSSKKALSVMKDLYVPFVRQGNPIFEMDLESAEVTKYASNSYLAMRITFMNEIANFCEKVGANVDMVRRGIASDNRIGKRFLFPGIGYGGSCFPKDVKALIKTSSEFKSEMTILKQVDIVNSKQKLVLIGKILEHFKNYIKNKHFAVWGLSFKPNTDDMREAASIVNINKLIEHGATVSAYDPAAMEVAKSIFKDSIVYAENQYDALKNADALLIFTEWNEFRYPDFNKIRSLLKNPLIFDGRNIFDLEKMEELGFCYYSIGRKPIEK